MANDLKAESDELVARAIANISSNAMSALIDNASGTYECNFIHPIDEMSTKRDANMRISMRS